MIHLLIGEIERSHHATFASDNASLVAFYLACFIEDYENDSLSFAIENLARTLDLIITEHRNGRETGLDNETLASISRNGITLTIIADAIRNARVTV